MYRFLLFLPLFLELSFAQSTDSFRKQIRIKFIHESIILDGKLTESFWSQLDSATDFWQHFPYDTSLAQSQTVVKVGFSEKALVIGAICYWKSPGKPVVQSLKRDFSFPVNEAFTVALDPFADGVNGFSFGVNPYNSQREGLIANGGVFGVTTSWDIRWFSETYLSDSFWSAELVIPFKSLRYNWQNQRWRINFARNDLILNENSTWTPVPRNFNVANLAFCGNAYWEKPLPKPGLNLGILPYAVSRQFFYYQDQAQEWEPSVGLDAKLTLRQSLSLDVTINPDFSEANVDRLVTNLTRFSIYYPERRQFFLENSDLFNFFGFRQIRPFFSRRIGLYQGRRVPIYGGVRLSGKWNKRWRIGFLDMHTAAVPDLDLQAQHYTVFAFQNQLFGRSYLGGIFVNRQGFQETYPIPKDYNRVAGLDFNYNSLDGKWSGKAFYHRSFSPQSLPNPYAHASFFSYQDIHWFVMWNHEYVGEGYDAQVGFTPRLFQYDDEQDTLIRYAYWRLEPMIRYRFYPHSRWLNFISPSIYLDQYMNQTGTLTDRYLEYGGQLQFQNSASISLKGYHTFTKILFPTTLFGTFQVPLPKGNYDYNGIIFSWESNYRKPFTFSIEETFGGFYIGTKWTSDLKIGWRLQPYSKLELNYRRDVIEMPIEYGSTILDQLGCDLEITFTENLYWNHYFQYITQLNYVSYYSRIQWRFAPMSDFFLVFVDEYDTQPFSVRNRSLLIKLTYWIQV